MAVSDKPWSNFTESDYTPEQYKRACLIDTGQGPPDSKSRYKLPVLEPDGALNRNGVHAAAGGHGVSAVQGCSDAQRRAAARKLVSMYKMDLNEDPPESLIKMAGMAMTSNSRNAVGDWYCRSTTFSDVRFKDRLITVAAAPYNSPSDITFDRSGDGTGDWTEIFSPGLFAGVEAAPHRIRVNREHDVNRTVGKVAGFIDTPEALVTQVKIARTPLGDETLTLADEECLSASVCFGVPPGGHRLERSARTRRINRAIMRHLSFVEDPAYKAAQVLSVRSDLQAFVGDDVSPTPILDAEIEAMADIMAWTKRYFDK